MPEYLSPGVYIREVSSGAKPIASAGTSIGAFIGIARQGPANKATFIANWTQFFTTFGGFNRNLFLAYAVYSFFAEGGSGCYVVNVDSGKATTAEAKADDKIKAKFAGRWGNDIKVKISDPSDSDKDKKVFFKVEVYYQQGKNPAEVFDNISIEKISELSLRSAYVDFSELSKRPANNEYQLAGGDDKVNNSHYIGTPANKQGLHALDEVDEILNIAIPDKAGDPDVIKNALAYCDNRTDCFFLIDPPSGMKPQDVKGFRDKGFSSSYGALYYPWVWIMDPSIGKRIRIPPSGLVAGIYAYTDTQRGVHKAPAGITDGRVKTAVGIESIVTKSEHDQLHPKNINVIRSFPSAGICVWGASTVSADPEWKYINLRRLFIMLRVSIYRATQWVVFEPNDTTLWSKVNLTVTAFLSRVWREGALFGSTPEEAFFVKVDAENNPPATRDVGQLHIDIGVAPVKPAEFVVFTITQKLLTQ